MEKGAIEGYYDSLSGLEKTLYWFQLLIGNLRSNIQMLVALDVVLVHGQWFTSPSPDAPSHLPNPL